MITLVGLDHRSAPVELRERLAFVEDEFTDALKGLSLILDEVFLLSTCNRTEIYAVDDRPDCATTLSQFIAERHNVEVGEVASHSYTMLGDDAVEHLFRVAAGLESMVLGETQILGQVRDAYRQAREAETIGRLLGRLLPLTLESGKRARSETAISRGSVSPSSTAVDLACRALGDVSGCTVLVIGAGDAGQATVQALLDTGIGRIIVANRSLERAVPLARRFRGRAVPLTDLEEELTEVDIVISSTASAEHIVTTEMVRSVMAKRPDRPLLFIDIAVPRDVDPGVEEVPGVLLYNIDDLEALCAANLSERQREVVPVESILAESLVEFHDWERTEQVAPVIGALYERAESIRKSELERTLRRLRPLSPDERETIEAMTGAIVRRLLHTPVAVLKSSQEGPQARTMASCVRQLFDLVPEDLTVASHEH